MSRSFSDFFYSLNNLNYLNCLINELIGKGKGFNQTTSFGWLRWVTCFVTNYYYLSSEADVKKRLSLFKSIFNPHKSSLSLISPEPSERQYFWVALFFGLIYLTMKKQRWRDTQPQHYYVLMPPTTCHTKLEATRSQNSTINSDYYPSKRYSICIDDV